MKSYTVLKMAEGVSWSDVPVIEMETRYEQTPDSISAYAQIAYNDEAVLVHQWTKEVNYRAVENGPLGSPFRDSCLEFFFSADMGDPRYFNIEFNSNGCQYFGFGRNGNKPALIRMITDIDKVFSPVINRHDDGWEITYQVPYSLIRMFFPDFVAETGKVISANVYKCADCSQPPHYIAWNPVPEQNLSFHRREYFGAMVFG